MKGEVQMNQRKTTNRSVQISIRLKLLILFTLLFTVVFAVAFYWFFQFATRLAEDDLTRDLAAIAETAAAGINGDKHQALYESDVPSGRPLTDERYREIVEWLVLVKETRGKVKAPDGSEDFRVHLYTYVATDEPGVVEFVGSSSALKQPPSGAEFRESYAPQSQAMRDGLTKTSVNIDVPIKDKWGRWVSGFAPVRNSQGEIVGTVGVDLRDTTVVALQNRIKNAVLPAFAVTYSVLFAAVLLFSYQISRPIITLTRSAERVAEGDYSEGVIPELSGFVRDETTTLAEVFRQMVAKVAAREQRLKKQVRELRIEIDEVKRKKQVSEIVESDFFQDLRAKARDMRSRSRRPAQDEPGDKAP
jgi:HAMP domain-containing protein